MFFLAPARFKKMTRLSIVGISYLGCVFAEEFIEKQLHPF